MKKRLILLPIAALILTLATGCKSGWTPALAVASCQAKWVNQSDPGIPASEYDALAAIDQAMGNSNIPAKAGVWPCRYTLSPCWLSGVGCQSGHVVHLILQTQSLSKLPPEVGQLTQLRTLYLYEQPLTELPPAIGQLTNLTDLFLSENQLTALPPEIGQLTNLQVLAVDANQLTELPPEIGQLSNLQSLYLGGNRLIALPPEVGQLQGLIYLDVSGNPITELPLEICAMPDLTIEPPNLCD